MISIDQILQLPDETIINGRDEEGKRYLAAVLAYHERTLGKTCASCPGKVLSYINSLRSYIKMNNIKKLNDTDQKGEFQLRKDAIVPIPGTRVVYGAGNMTDEVAIKILQRNPGAIRLFKKFPKNWEKLIAKAEKLEAEKETPDAPTTYAELKLLTNAVLKELFPLAKGKSKEEILDSIAEKYPGAIQPAADDIV